MCNYKKRGILAVWNGNDKERIRITFLGFLGFFFLKVSKQTGGKDDKI
jgi:hypothetical protein